MDEQNIPIDIHLHKLLDWLVSRRICPKDWQKNILTVRQKINNAIQDMPAVEEITDLLSGTYINYFHCLRIVELLKETESSSKNIFGMYSSQRMKDWLEIIKLYEKDNIYLAEGAQLMHRTGMYELPALKRQLTKCRQTQEECSKKDIDYAKNETAMREKYLAACQHIGIEGKNIRKELLSLLDDLPGALNEIAVSAKELSSVRDYYLCFLEFTLPNAIERDCVPLLKYIIEKGNTTIFEWRTGEAPEIIEGTTPVFPLDVDSGSNETADDQIDFGDFGPASESSGRSSNSPNGDFVHVEKDDCKSENNEQINFDDSEINWDISVEASDISIINTPEENEGGKVARGTDALSVLENEATRNLFFCDLLELEAFLEQRLLELKSAENDVLYSSMFHNAPPLLQMQSSSDMHAMLASVKNISSQLITEKIRYLFMIKSSNRYIDRFVDSLKSKLETAERMAECQKAVKAKHHEAVEEQDLLLPKIQLIIKKLKILFDQVENDISKRYKNRKVTIMGGSKILQL